MKSAKILIVEDEKQLNQAYQTILESHGYKPEGVYDGETAIAAIEQNKPDLVLLDLNLPKVNGLEVLKKMEKLDKKPTVVVFSNQEVEKDIAEAFDFGVKHYLLKAWASPNELVRVVKEALA